MLEIGQRVKVKFPPKNEKIAKGMFRYEGMVTTIKDIVHYTHFNLETYILEGCVSPFGLHYEFFEDSVIPLVEESEGKDDTETESN